MPRRSLLLVLLPLLLPAAAPAATVTVRPEPGDDGNDQVHYVAAPGEANRVLVAYAGDARSVTITDPGATITALGSCTSIDPHTARCVKRPEQQTEWLQSTRVELGDGDDEVATTRPTPFPIGGVDADGGPGNDRLDGGAGSDVLDGGGGTDVLLGGDGFDELSDGDVDGAADADVLDGGGELDSVSYARRRAGVVVDLGAGTGGAPGEGDAVRGIENATGGAGGDRLLGDGQANLLSGGAGDDVLRARPGRDQDGFGDVLRGGAGDDRLDGGKDPDVLFPGRGDDAIACGRGPDRVFDPRLGEHLSRACEDVTFSLSATAEDALSFPAHPRSVRRGTAVFALRCPDLELLDGSESSCRGTLTLREAGGRRRLIGRGRLQGELEEIAPPTRVRLTALGRRRAAREDGVRVNATVAGRNLPRRTWTITLRAG